MDRFNKREMSVNTDHLEDHSYYCTKSSWHPAAKNYV